MDNFSGKTAVVTGGGSGIGRALALRFAAEGLNVVVADIAEADAQAVVDEIVAAGGNAMAARVDVGMRESVMELAAAAQARFGGVHVLCNNAGVLKLGTAQTLAAADWDWTLDINIGGVVNGLLAFVPGMVAQGEGHIVNTGSIAGLSPNTTRGLIAYTTSKYAVVGLTESLRTDLQGTGVSASVLCPGGVRTQIFTAVRNKPERFGGAEEVAVARAAAAGTGADLRLMDPSQVAECVLDGIRKDELYILTHPETRVLSEARARDLSAAFDRAAARDAART